MFDWFWNTPLTLFYNGYKNQQKWERLIKEDFKLVDHGLFSLSLLCRGFVGGQAKQNDCAVNGLMSLIGWSALKNQQDDSHPTPSALNLRIETS